MRLLLTALSVFVLLLSGCAQQPAPNAGRYAMEKDKYPDTPPDVSQVPDATPLYEPYSRRGNDPQYTVLGKQYQVMHSHHGYQETGIASWYGEKFHGHETSNGEIYDMYAMTAAHKSLPLPSFLRVTNLDNNRSVIVRVNDRGPFHEDRLIDLSYAAAWKLGYLDKGTARVKLEAISIEPAPEQQIPRYFVQLSASQNRKTVEQQQLAVVQGSEIHQEDGLYKLRVGPFTSSVHAEQLKQQLRAQGHPQAFLIRL